MRSLRLALVIIATLTAEAQTAVVPRDILSLYRASLHTFWLLRSGIAISDPPTGIEHQASHLEDAVPLPNKDGRSLSGGWYNAGDYGKWTMMTALSASYMLHLYADQEQRGKADPSLLDAAEWGLAWLLKMQDPDGGVRHKVDSGSFAALGKAWGLAPESDPTVRLASDATTLDTADFSAVMYQASRLFSRRDPAASMRFYLAAQDAYSWMMSHPHVRVEDPFYNNDDPGQEVLWADCERVASGEDVAEFALTLRHVHVAESSWNDPSLLGLYSIASSRTVSHNLRLLASRSILNAAISQAKAAERRSFRVALASDEYVWGSAERVLHRASLFMMANHLRPSVLLDTAAQDQLAWLLGNNSLHHSLVVSYGVNPVLHPYHWSYMVYGKLMPGWAVGGPNGSGVGADPLLLQLAATRCTTREVLCRQVLP